jgi:glycosyltransferase involved in cell wall biosynthesis
MTVRVEPRVSIVTPMYNVAEHIEQCIESVLAQTYRNWDYTIVDNCSTDGSLEIARRFAATDSRIRIEQNEAFLPAICNHNMAVRQIAPTSKYCKVVFGDDWIYPECLEKMVAVAEAHPTIGLVGAYCLKGRDVVCTGLEPTEEVFEGHWICREHLLRGVHVFGSANTVLYRADLVRGRDPFFNEANIHADTEVCFDVLRTSDFGFVHQVLSFTRERAGSLNTVSNERHSYFSGTLRILASRGREYLTSAELRMLQRSCLREYYRFLGRSLVAHRGSDFWAFHKRQLLELRVGWSRHRLVRGALETAVRAILSPKGTITKRLKIRMAAQMPGRGGRFGSGTGGRRESLGTIRRGDRTEGPCR